MNKDFFRCLKMYLFVDHLHTQLVLNFTIKHTSKSVTLVPVLISFFQNYKAQAKITVNLETKCLNTIRSNKIFTVT